MLAVARDRDSMGPVPPEVHLRVGETSTLPLAGSGGGYRWRCQVSGDEECVDVAVDYAEADPGPGRWRNEVATIRGLAPGHAVVRFARQRPWEPPSEATAANDQVVVDVTVLET